MNIFALISIYAITDVWGGADKIKKLDNYKYGEANILIVKTKTPVKIATNIKINANMGMDFVFSRVIPKSGEIFLHVTLYIKPNIEHEFNTFDDIIIINNNNTIHCAYRLIEKAYKNKDLWSKIGKVTWPMNPNVDIKIEALFIVDEKSFPELILNIKGQPYKVATLL